MWQIKEKQLKIFFWQTNRLKQELHVKEEKTVCRRKYLPFWKYSRQTASLLETNLTTPTNLCWWCMLERLIICKYLLKTWQHWVNWWTSMMKNQPMSHCLYECHINMYFKIPQKHIFSTPVYLTKKKSNQGRLQALTQATVESKQACLLVLLRSFIKKTTT